MFCHAGLHVHVARMRVTIIGVDELTPSRTPSDDDDDDDDNDNRYTASTSTYSLTFRVRVATPRIMDEYERRTQQARPFYRRRGESSAACAVCVCGMRAACGGPGGLPLGSATHFHSVAVATQPVHRLQIRPIVHN